MAAGVVIVLSLLLAPELLPRASAVDRSEFPEDFLFGTSTSAYQVRLCRCAVLPDRHLRKMLPCPFLLLHSLGWDALPCSSLTSLTLLSDSSD
jgi:hypothetical protein